MAYDFRLVDYKQQVRLVTTGRYEEHTFVGSQPFIVAANARNNLLSQVGFAVGLDAIPDAPAPLFPDTLAQDKEVRHTRIDSIHWRTDWNYLMYVASDYAPDLAVVEATPSTPTFQTAPT